jgi:hypothetical protein
MKKKEVESKDLLFQTLHTTTRAYFFAYSESVCLQARGSPSWTPSASSPTSLMN